MTIKSICVKFQHSSPFISTIIGVNYCSIYCMENYILCNTKIYFVTVLRHDSETLLKSIQNIVDKNNISRNIHWTL